MSDIKEEQRNKYNFLDGIVPKKDETGEEPSTSFKVGFALGTALVTVGGIALEAVLIGAGAAVLGLSLGFWQCLVIALTFEYVIARKSV